MIICWLDLNVFFFSFCFSSLLYTLEYSTPRFHFWINLINFRCVYRFWKGMPITLIAKQNYTHTHTNIYIHTKNPRIGVSVIILYGSLLLRLFLLVFSYSILHIISPFFCTIHAHVPESFQDLIITISRLDHLKFLNSIFQTKRRLIDTFTWNKRSELK